MRDVSIFLTDGLEVMRGITIDDLREDAEAQIEEVVDVLSLFYDFFDYHRILVQ